MTDQSLELTVAIARNRHGGARRKLQDLAHDEVIKKNRMHLFSPLNSSNNLCFALCLANYLNRHTTIDMLESIALGMQRRVGFTPEQMIGLTDVGKFETAFNVK